MMQSPQDRIQILSDIAESEIEITSGQGVEQDVFFHQLKHDYSNKSQNMMLTFRAAQPEDAIACIVLRGQTRQNSFSEEALAALGITLQTWEQGIREATSPGFVCLQSEALVGMCFFDSKSGEILVVAIHPEHEGCGIGKVLLEMALEALKALGHTRSLLGCNADPASRSHGFYRHLGWKPTGETDTLGDEVLELDLLPIPDPVQTERLPPTFEAVSDPDPRFPDPYEGFDLFQECLCTMMRRVSEEAYSAGWLKDLEYDLWRILEEGPQAFGFAWLHQSRIDKLRQLAKLTSGWIVQGENGPHWVPMDEWLERYRIWKTGPFA